MTIKFIIIDNEANVVRHIRALIAKLDVGQTTTWPSDDRTFENWGEAWDAVVGLERMGWQPSTECCVLVLDVALGMAIEDIDDGIQQISRQLRSDVFLPYVTIIATRFEGELRRKLVGEVDYIVDKELLYGENGSKIFSHTLLGALARWSKRTGRSNPVLPKASEYRRVDSVAMRRVEASLGGEVIERLGSEVARDWSAVSVEALSGGYSGAVLLSFADPSANRRVVCKVSRSQALIRDEVDRTEKAFAFDFYSPHLPPQTEARHLPNDARIAYVVLASVSGSTLEMEMLKAVEGDEESRLRSASVVGELCNIAVKASNVRNVASASQTNLITEDLNRFEASMGYLLPLKDACIKRGLLSTADWNRTELIERFYRGVVTRWNELFPKGIGALEELSPQHGDLNPRNVLVGPDGRVTLIDFARFGGWPAGYDLVRLELQLLLRVLSRHEEADSFPFDLDTWWQFWEAYRNAGSNFEFGSGIRAVNLLVPLLNGINASRQRIYSNRRYDQVQGRRLTNLLRCLDAIKMCSYQDATSFKRLFFLLVAVNCAIGAELL